MYPGTPPPQEDVLESRVLARTDNRLRVYLKLSRSAIVTVVYDTEHDVTFTRHSPTDGDEPQRLDADRRVLTAATAGSCGG